VVDVTFRQKEAIAGAAGAASDESEDIEQEHVC